MHRLFILGKCFKFSIINITTINKNNKRNLSLEVWCAREHSRTADNVKWEIVEALAEWNCQMVVWGDTTVSPHWKSLLSIAGGGGGGVWSGDGDGYFSLPFLPISFPFLFLTISFSFRDIIHISCIHSHILNCWHINVPSIEMAKRQKNEKMSEIDKGKKHTLTAEKKTKQNEMKRKKIKRILMLYVCVLERNGSKGAREKKCENIIKGCSKWKPVTRAGDLSTHTYVQAYKQTSKQTHSSQEPILMKSKKKHMNERMNMARWMQRCTSVCALIRMRGIHLNSWQRIWLYSRLSWIYLYMSWLLSDGRLRALERNKGATIIMILCASATLFIVFWQLF